MSSPLLKFFLTHLRTGTPELPPAARPRSWNPDGRKTLMFCGQWNGESTPGVSSTGIQMAAPNEKTLENNGEWRMEIRQAPSARDGDP